MSLPLRSRLLGRLRAFTVLEMLVVVVILGILAALGIFQFNRVQEKAYVATMMNDLRNFATSRAIYVSEAERYPEAVNEVAGHLFSEFVYDAGYRNSGIEWALLVGHNKTDTKCVLSTYETGGGAHRIHCGTDETLPYDVFFGTDPWLATFDASRGVEKIAFTDGSAMSLRELQAAPKGEIALVAWDYGDGTREAGAVETHTQETHRYLAPGTYQTSLTVVKRGGFIGRGTKEVVIGATEYTDPKLTGCFVSDPLETWIDNPTLLTAPTHDVQGRPLTDIRWDLMSLGTAEGPQYTATFPRVGVYWIHLSMRDADGEELRCTGDVTVHESAPSGIPTDSGAGGGGGGGGTSQVPAYLDIKPDSMVMTQGSTHPAVAIYLDSAGVVLPTYSTTWTSSDTTLVRVSSSGVVTARGVGSVTLTAQGAGLVGEEMVTVVLDGGGGTSAREPVSLSVMPTPSTVRLSDLLPLFAIYRDKEQVILSGYSTLWEVSDTTVAHISDSGILTPRKAGTVVVTGYGAGLSGEGEVTVVEDSTGGGVSSNPPTSLSIIPNPSSVLLGKIRQLAPLYRDSVGREVEAAPTTWTSSDTTVATVSASGVVTPRRLGTITITAQGAGLTGEGSMTVEEELFDNDGGSDPVPTSLAIAPNPAGVVQGETLQLMTIYRDEKGLLLSNYSTEWTSSDPAVASVSTSGQVTGLSVGSVTITAQGAGLTGQGSLEVVPEPTDQTSARTPTTLQVMPNPAAVALGEPLTMGALYLDSAGVSMSAEPPIWSSSNPGVAEVNGSGAISTKSLGTVTITAQGAGLTGTGSLTVQEPAPGAEKDYSDPGAFVERTFRMNDLYPWTSPAYVEKGAQTVLTGEWQVFEQSLVTQTGRRYTMRVVMRGKTGTAGKTLNLGFRVSAAQAYVKIARGSVPGYSESLGTVDGVVEFNRVEVVYENPPPTAAFAHTAETLSVAFDASSSVDPEGRGLTYDWDFGDWSTGTGQTTSHTYVEKGEYSVRLIVTDVRGQADTLTKTLRVPTNWPPVAAFSFSPDNRVYGTSISFDASASSDPEAQTLTYAWDFGDWTTGTGKVVSKSYTAAGEYWAQLIVTDPEGKADTVTHKVTVTAPIFTDFSGYSTGSIPGDWTRQYAGVGTYAVREKVEMAGGKSLEFTDTNPNSGLRALSWNLPGTHSDVEIFARMRTSGGSGDDVMGLVLRGSGSSPTGYTLGFNSSYNQLALSRWVNGAATGLAGANGAWSANVMLNVRFRAIGSQIQVRWWTDGTAEPSTWQISVTDGGVTGPGWVGVTAQREGATRDWDYFSVGTGGDAAYTPAEFRNRPARPSLGYTVAGQGAVTLVGSAFSQESNSHVASEWRVTAAGDFNAVVHSVTSTTDLVQHTVAGLVVGTNYDAHVRYRGSNGSWSAWSTKLTFTAPGQIASTDFSTYTTGSSPSGWTRRYYGAGTYAIQERTGVTGGKVLEFTDANSNLGLRTLSWDNAGSLADVEILARMRTDGVTGDDGMGLILRGSGSSPTGYTFTFNSSNNQASLKRWINGAKTDLVTANWGWSANVMYNVRFRATGSQIQVRWWADGTTEPSSWQFSATDSGVTGPGWVGVTAQREVGTRQWDTFAVAAGGATAGQ